jgi:olefin beta-lactone synthetase
VSRNPNIAARLAERAARHPGRAAIIEGRGRGRRVISFGELADRVARAGRRLRDGGLEPGDRVLLFVPMSADLYVSLLGVLHAGGVAVFLDAWAGRQRLDDAVAAAGPKVFVGTWKAHLLRLLSPSLRRVPTTIRPAALSRPPGDRGAGGAREPGAAAAVAGADHALVTFTTGSTGRPKAAARSHAFLWAQHRVLARHLALREDDIDMPTLPVFVLNNLALGVTTVLPDFDPRRPADIDPAAVLAQIRHEGVTTTSGSPAFYQRLVAHASRRGESIPVRALFTGGAPVFPPLARALAGAVDGEAHVLYGSTEAEPIASIRAADLARLTEAPGALGVCVGRPVPEIDLRIIRPVDGPVTAGDLGDLGDLGGEVIVAGEHVLRGYLDDPAAEALAKIRDGERVWHRTGDGGFLDADGLLWLLGRIGDRVEREGATGWPMAAEARALSVGGVRYAAYLGVRERAVLCLELEEGEGRTGAGAGTGLEERVREALAPIPVDEVRVMAQIPRDPRHASKTDTVRLRALLG